MAKLNINWNNVEAATGVRPIIPTGWQRMLVLESEEKPTANHADTGNLLIGIKVQIIDGPYANQVVYKNFNLKNDNQQAQDIGWGEMKALNDALGLVEVEDTNMWHNKPFLGHIKLVPARKDPKTGVEYDAKNEINGFKDINDDTVEVNHNIVRQSGGQNVVMDPGVAKGGSPVPKVGAQAPSAMPASVAAAAKPAAAPAAAAPAKPAAPTKPTAPATPAKPAAPAPRPKIKQLQMTEKAQGMSKEDFVAADPAWTDELLKSEGYMIEIEVDAPEPEASAAPSAPAAPAAAAPAAGGAVPPWLQGK